MGKPAGNSISLVEASKDTADTNLDVEVRGGARRKIGRALGVRTVALGLLAALGACSEPFCRDSGLCLKW